MTADYPLTAHKNSEQIFQCNIGVLLASAQSEGCLIFEGLTQGLRSTAPEINMHAYFTDNYQTLPAQINRLEHYGYHAMITVGPTMVEDVIRNTQGHKNPLPLICILPYANSNTHALFTRQQSLTLINGPVYDPVKMISFYRSIHPAMRSVLIPYQDKGFSPYNGWSQTVLYPTIAALQKAEIQAIPLKVDGPEEIYAHIAGSLITDTIMLLEGTDLITHHGVLSQRCRHYNKTLFVGSKHAAQQSLSCGYAVDSVELGRHISEIIWQQTALNVSTDMLSEYTINVPYEKITNIVF